VHPITSEGQGRRTAAYQKLNQIRVGSADLVLYRAYNKDMRVVDIIWHRWLGRPYTLHVAVDEGEHQAPPVVLLHGIASSAAVWRPVVRHLAAPGSHRVIALDLLGFGGSPRPTYPQYTVHDHARAVLHTLQKLRLKGQLTLIGHSMGCLVATHIAAQVPEVVRNLILYEPPLFADDPAYRSHARRTAQYKSFYEYLLRHPELLMLQHRRLYRLAQRVSGFALSPETWLPFERSLKNTILRQKAFNELHRITMPTAIIHGRLDLVVVQAQVKRMFANNPHITLHKVTATHGITTGAARLIGNLL
jgi:cis-3-alkyl-4-acyloxetan-2-one decarboxylase